MANAMEVLGDNVIIYKVFDGNFLKFYKSDDETAIFLKKYINEAVARALKHHDDYKEIWTILVEEYRMKHAKWVKRGMQGPSPKWPSSHWIGDSRDFIELKVNHYRQKFWYWKKLKE